MPKSSTMASITTAVTSQPAGRDASGGVVPTGYLVLSMAGSGCASRFSASSRDGEFASKPIGSRLCGGSIVQFMPKTDQTTLSRVLTPCHNVRLRQNHVPLVEGSFPIIKPGNSSWALIAYKSPPAQLSKQKVKAFPATRYSHFLRRCLLVQ